MLSLKAGEYIKVAVTHSKPSFSLYYLVCVCVRACVRVCALTLARARASVRVLPRKFFCAFTAILKLRMVFV